MLLLLAACQKGDSEGMAIGDPIAAAARSDQAKLERNLAEAEVTFEGRFDKAVRRNAALIEIDDDMTFTTYLMPGASNWTIACGVSGLEVVFGGPVASAPESYTYDGDVELSAAHFTRESCRRVGPRLALHIQNRTGQIAF